MSEPVLFSTHFFHKNNSSSRAVYFRIYLPGCLLVVTVIFAVLSIYWGSLWSTPVRNIHGWVVDFDGGEVGQAVVQGLTSPSASSKVTWAPVNASEFPGGLGQVRDALIQQKTWAAVTINGGSTARLQSSYVTPNALYNGSTAITVYANEARNEIA